MMGPVLSAAGRARIRPAPVLDTEGDNENRVVTLRIDFDEGKQFHFGKLMVLGNELHQGDSERIRDAWRFNEGDGYNGEAVEKFWNDIAPYLPLGWQLEQHMEICQDASSAVATLAVLLPGGDSQAGRSVITPSHPAGGLPLQ